MSASGLPQMRGQSGLEVSDLEVQLDDDAYRGAGSRSECGGDRSGSGELLGAQHSRDLLGGHRGCVVAQRV